MNSSEVEFAGKEGLTGSSRAGCWNSSLTVGRARTCKSQNSRRLPRSSACLLQSLVCVYDACQHHIIEPIGAAVISQTFEVICYMDATHLAA